MSSNISSHVTKRSCGGPPPKSAVMVAKKNKASSHMVIGVDPHKRIDAVVVLDELGAVLAREIVPHTSAGFKTLMAQAGQFPNRVWAVEGCNGVGKNLAHRLVADGERVLDVSTRKSSLVRALATNSGRKTDDTDAYSIALVGLRSPDLPVVVRDQQTEPVRLLSHRRRELVGLRTQAVCRRRVTTPERHPNPGPAQRDPAPG